MLLIRRSRESWTRADASRPFASYLMVAPRYKRRFAPGNHQGCVFLPIDNIRCLAVVQAPRQCRIAKVNAANQ
jgi:hypothetical protein